VAATHQCQFTVADAHMQRPPAFANPYHALGNPDILQTLQKMYPLPVSNVPSAAPRVPHRSTVGSKNGTHVGNAGKKTVMAVKAGQNNKPASPKKRLPVFNEMSPNAKRQCEEGDALKPLEEYGDQLRVTRQLFGEHMDTMKKVSKFADSTTLKWTKEVAQLLKVELDAITRRAFEQGHVQGELKADKMTGDSAFASGYMQGKISVEAEYKMQQESLTEIKDMYEILYKEHEELKEVVKLLRTVPDGRPTALMHCEENAERAFWACGENDNHVSYEDLQRMVESLVADEQPTAGLQSVVNEIQDLFNAFQCHAD